jgi:hypothetical protein
MWRLIRFALLGRGGQQHGVIDSLSEAHKGRHVAPQIGDNYLLVCDGSVFAWVSAAGRECHVDDAVQVTESWRNRWSPKSPKRRHCRCPACRREGAWITKSLRLAEGPDDAPGLFQYCRQAARDDAVDQGARCGAKPLRQLLNPDLPWALPLLLS